MYLLKDWIKGSAWLQLVLTLPFQYGPDYTSTMPPCTLPFQKNLLEVAPRHYNLLRQLLTYSHVIMPILQEDYFVQGNQKLSLKMEEKKKKKTLWGNSFISRYLRSWNSDVGAKPVKKVLCFFIGLMPKLDKSCPTHFQLPRYTGLC